MFVIINSFVKSDHGLLITISFYFSLIRFLYKELKKHQFFK